MSGSANYQGRSLIVDGFAVNRTCRNVYGDQRVARRLVDSLTPEKKVTVVRTGDSRGVDQTTERNFQQYGFGIPWAGCGRGIGPLAGGGAPWTVSVYDPSTAPVAIPNEVYLGRITPGTMWRVLFANGAFPGGSNDRFFGSAELFSPAIHLAQAPQMIGRPAKASLFVRKDASGVTGADYRIWVRNGAQYVRIHQTAFTTVSAVPETVRIDVDVPSWDYSAQTIYCEGGGWGPTIAGETINITGFLYESDIGVTDYNLCVGGRTTASYQNDDMFSPALWSEFIRLLSGEIVLWMSLGTNDGGRTRAEVEAFKSRTLAIIAEFHNEFPGNYVVIDTAYEAGGEMGMVTARRRAYIEIAQSTPGVMCIDCYAELGCYGSLLLGGFYTAGDSVHGNALGRQLYAAIRSDMVARYAQ